jgi:hypothetical protein
MMKFVRPLWLTCLSALTVFCMGAAHSVEYQCAHDMVIRSVAVKYEERGHQVPCEVIYSKPPHIPKVLWRAQAQVDFCERRAEELVRTLERSGWSCEEIQDPAAINAGQESARLAGSVNAPSLQQTRRTEATAASFRGGRSKRSADLTVALARDLRALEEGSGTEVQAGSPSFGDLNGDGQLDAAVLITFASGGTDQLHYLLAYVYAQGAYRLVASRFIGGSYHEVYSGELEAIEAGMIFLRLEFGQTEDIACCPSGNRTATFVLENGDLVRLK